MSVAETMSSLSSRVWLEASHDALLDGERKEEKIKRQEGKRRARSLFSQLPCKSPFQLLGLSDPSS